MTKKELRKALRNLELNEELRLGSDTVRKCEKGYGLETKSDEGDYSTYEFIEGYKEKDIIEIAIMEELIK